MKKGNLYILPKKLVAASDKGTYVTFFPDPEIFDELEYSYDILSGRMRELSFLNKGLVITITDERNTDDKGEFITDTFKSEKGLSEFVRFLDENREGLIEEVIHVEGEKNGVPVEVAMIYNTSYSENPPLLRKQH